jgi:uncharacterized protein YcbK (DUF882 family)
MVDDGIEQRPLSRRHFLKLGALAATGLVSKPVLARRHSAHERSLALYNTHTSESLKTVYWAQGRYLTAALADINRILRDHYTDEIKPIDGELLDLLYLVRRKVAGRGIFHVVSAYRSPATNAMLRRHDPSVAQNSLHMVGKAVDIRLPGRELALLRRAALSLRRGGVGYYPDSNFIHVDVGRVRHW